ncbi:NADP-dependent oxidoreductase [Mycolicibacterium sp. J2]|uniref:NADP-dependent oxidoreductase n=1 Tax=Mycolicibacterium sp. J2 TaxID=2993511 RepID=UPI00224A890D|nr:NADP-dependent oxidoreductase [Mycolicibacterium sp. J2]MCX2713619.1 NADP-dependent oxidoreductase [Mycolicibacterium sp. J2]
MPTTMQAIRFHQFGGPEVLQYDTVPVPTLQAGEVLVRVHAVGLNPPDWYLRDGYRTSDLPADLRPSIPLPAIPGSDISGVVEAAAADVDGFTVGDEVFGMLRFPSFGDSAAYAEYVTAPATDLALKPPGIDHTHAAAAAMSGLTAWQFLIDLGHEEPNPLQPQTHRPVPLAGATVLVNGAAGGVGHLAVQLARHQGATVIAVASGRHESFLRELGVDEFIDYTTHDPQDTAHDVDLVLDTLGGPATGRFLQCIKRGGALFPVFPGFSDATEAAERGVTVSMTQVRSNGNQLADLGALLDDGTIVVAIDGAYPLEKARSAHERAELGHIQGKIVLTVD